MLSGLLACLARVKVTACYAVTVTSVAAVMSTMDPESHDALIRHASTNLHNLSHGRFGTLVGSALVVDSGPIYLWLPGLVCLLALAELLWGSGRLVVAFGVGHIGATLAVAAGLVGAVRLGWMSASVAHAPDVGMSYGAMAVVGSLVSAMPSRWRVVWTGWWLAVAAVVVASPGRDFTDVGHAVAMVLGMAVSTRFGVPSRWSPSMAVLLTVAAVFGFLVLADDVVTMVCGAVSALVGLLVHEVFSQRRRSGVRATRGAPREGAPRGR